MLRVKQANDLNFFTVPTTSPLANAMMPVFMGFRGPRPIQTGRRPVLPGGAAGDYGHAYVGGVDCVDGRLGEIAVEEDEIG